VHIKQAAFTTLYLTSSTTAYAAGTATCTISGATSSCPISVTLTADGTHAGSFTLTYDSTTLGATLDAGHVAVGPEKHGAGGDALRGDAAARQAPVTHAVTVTPAAAAMTGTLSASLLGVSLTGGLCATATLVYSDGTASGTVSCLLLGVAGIDIDVELPATSGTTSNTGVTTTGTATATVAGLLPVALPATAALTTSGLALTVGGIALPTLPVGTGSIEIG